MRQRAAMAGSVLFIGGLIASACGGGGSNFGNPDGSADATQAGDGGQAFDSTGPLFGDVNTEAAPPCVGLKCNVVNCGGSAHTTISGTVYDPAGKNPLYNVIVYVPTSATDPLPAITHGATCEACAATIKNAVATALTDATGKFQLVDVPVGSNIPLVVQVGKWRRKYTMPSVAQCVDNAYPDPPTPATKLRLPAKQSEGDMPLIAFNTGCDPMEDLIKKVGVDPSEFTNPSGTGMVRVYQGKYSNNAGVTSPGDSYAFWANQTEMMKYDIVVNACECSPYPRGGGYQALDNYLNAGGRFFGSHYHINFFGDTSAAADLHSAASWAQWGSCGTGPFNIDTSFPKGKAMADWMKNIFPTQPYGQVIPTSGCIVKDISATVSGISQQWIYDNASKYPSYISINTPTTAQPADRCGRAVLSDLHVGTSSSTLAEQEAALEFMFFDLAACVTDDGSAPQPPLPN
jgi:hypothetical protein